jgi:hypothetical protein
MKVPEGKNSKGEQFKLSFRFDEKEYTTIFSVLIYPNTMIRIFNSCLKIRIRPDILEVSEISSNTGEESCFEPRLVSDRRNKPGLRVSSTDILQTLKTKLAFCLSPDITSIPLIDAAMIGKIEISKFNILRGKPAIYEKYGYRSASMDQFKTYINRLTWSDLDDNMKQIILDSINKSIIFEPRPISFELDRPLTDIMKMISLESENTYSYYNNPSSIIFNRLFMNMGYDEDYEEAMHTYILKKDDPIWKSWDRGLLFTGFEIITSAGSRGKTQKTQKTQRKSIRRRRNTKRHRVYRVLN